MGYEPRKTVGKLKEQSPFERMVQLNRFMLALLPMGQAPVNRGKDGSRPARKIVGRPQSR
jgi:hypothetical protein